MTTPRGVSLAAWARTAPRGASIVYHQGHLAYDRGGSGAPVQPVHMHAVAAESLAAYGYVNLVQRRVPGREGCAYIMQRTDKPFRGCDTTWAVRQMGCGDRFRISADDVAARLIPPGAELRHQASA